jgi:hypothetical protein
LITHYGLPVFHFNSSKWYKTGRQQIAQRTLACGLSEAMAKAFLPAGCGGQGCPPHLPDAGPPVRTSDPAIPEKTQ